MSAPGNTRNAGSRHSSTRPRDKGAKSYGIQGQGHYLILRHRHRHRRRATALATLLEQLLVVAMGGVVILIARDDTAQYLGQLGLRLEAD